MAENENQLNADVSRGIEINGVTYYPLTAGPRLNPCAGKVDGSSCGGGCVCKSGQCYYTTFRLQQMGIKIEM
ncbi:hypothetical protein [Rhizobium herbae]|uniref:Bacteriocin n=1 Tax=Rhizobium herbae TaxID=508661 RepID=A0ABS4EUM2_9HYPH|nr:hypothetical protein [Rhizobium herbae]MBP1861632.1 hypothetical protein [Rhizobium herbae]